MNDKQLAEVPLNYARMTVRDLIQQAYDAGRSAGVEGEQTLKPSAKEVNEAIAALEAAAISAFNAEYAVHATEEAQRDARMAELYGKPELAPDAWDFYGLPPTKLGRGLPPFGGAPVYYWNGRTGRPGNRYAHTQLGLPVTAEHVIVDETRGEPSDTCESFVCRIINSVEPLSLGHTIVIARSELQPVGDDWKPLT
jgi:hypothetical protein